MCDDPYHTTIAVIIWCTLVRCLHLHLCQRCCVLVAVDAVHQADVCLACWYMWRAKVGGASVWEWSCYSLAHSLGSWATISNWLCWLAIAVHCVELICYSTYSISAFSLSLSLILKHRQVTINPYSKIGRVESDFLSQLVTQADVEAKADNCMKVYAWREREEEKWSWKGRKRDKRRK